MLFLLCPLSLVAAKDDVSAQSDLIKKLPGKLAKVEWKKQSPTEIEKVLGSAAEKETKDGLDYHYYSFDGLKFDTSVVFKNGKLSHIVYMPGNTKWTIKDFQSFFPATKLDEARKIANEKKSHESGREFFVESKESGVGTVVSDNKTYNIRKIILWPPGEVKP